MELPEPPKPAVIEDPEYQRLKLAARQAVASGLLPQGIDEKKAIIIDDCDRAWCRVTMEHYLPRLASSFPTRKETSTL